MQPHLQEIVRRLEERERQPLAFDRTPVGFGPLDDDTTEPRNQRRVNAELTRLAVL
jgi:hypothetical protein